MDFKTALNDAIEELTQIAEDCRGLEVGARVLMAADRLRLLVDEQTVIRPSTQHRTIHGTNLAIRRTALVDASGKPVTQAAFAAQCGHSVMYQCQLERPGEHEVLAEKAGQIESALNYFEKQKGR
jgi:hypothetical protein